MAANTVFTFSETRIQTHIRALDSQTDWQVNPIGWINELYQDPILLSELHLSSGYSLKTDVSFDRIYTFNHAMTYHMSNQARTISRYSSSRKNVEKEAAYEFCRRMHVLAEVVQTADAQMDSTQATEQGTDNVVGDKEVNTILTLGTSTQSNDGVSPFSQIQLSHLASSQEKARFDVLLDRWLQIDHFVFNTTDTLLSLKTTWTLPDFFYNNTDTPNKLPFHQFVLMQPNIQLKFKVNSHKFAQGKYVVSYIYDSDRFDGNDSHGNVWGAVQRPHVLLDLNESNEAELIIPYRAKTPYIFTLANQQEISSGQYVKVFLHCITPLRVPDATPTTVPCTLFIKFPKTHFTGMRYYKDVTMATANAQMGNETSRNVMSGLKSLPIVGSLVSPIANSMGNFAAALERPFLGDARVNEVEKQLKYIGVINNRDKPAEIRQPNELRPNVAGNLAVGVDVEPLNVMRLDPTATTIMLPEHCTVNTPLSVRDIIQIWGLESTFTWAIANAAEAKLYEEIVWPTYHTNNNVVTTHNSNPLGHLCKYYQYYTGSVEYRFDLVCTQFHTGTLMVSYIPYNESYTYSEARSGYYKTFDLREQKSFTFKVPYIRNTVLQALPYTAPKLNAGISVPTIGTLAVWVVNPLTPIQSVATTVDIIVYKRAGEDFQLVYPIDSLANQGTFTPDYNGPLAITADAQMEDGTKEEIDTSPVFDQVSPYSARVQVNEDHMNIKDLLRRWVYVDEFVVAGGISFGVFPLNFYGRYRYSLQGWLMNLYRWSRGGLCFMFQSEPGHQFRIAHWPQTTSSDSYPEGTGGMATQYWDTSINSTYKLEVPFHGMFNYQDIQLYGTLPETYDLIPFNLGILQIHRISGTSGSTVRQWVRVADDFELVEFIGCGNRTNLDRQAEAANAQMDLTICGDVESNPGPDIQDGGVMSQYTSWMPNLDFHTRVWGGVKNISSSVLNPIKSTSAAMLQAPAAVSALKVASDTWTKTGEKTGEIMEYLKDIALNITNTIKNSCSWVKNISNIFNAVLHFLQLILKPSWQSFVISIVGIFTSIGSVFSKIGESLFSFFMNLNRTPTEHPAGGTNAEPQMEDFTSEDTTNLCALLFGAISGFLGYKGTAPSFSKWTKLLNMSNNFWRTISGASRFLTSIISLFKKIFHWILERTPIARNYFTLYSENEEICDFVKEAQYCTSEVNIQALQDNPAFKYRFWVCVVLAYKLQQKLIVKPEKNTQALLRLIQKVIDKSNELVVSMVASPVRYEPFVLTLEGQTKIGKSFMAQEALPKFLHEAFEVEGFGAPIFTRTPGVEFWNGFTNQRCILYDDFLAVLDPLIAVPQVVEMYNLKSTAIMNANMPDMESKKIRANPYLVAVLENHGFTVLNGTVDPQAFLRRSDSKWKVSIKPEFANMSFARIPEEVKRNFTHLQFQRYTDPADPRSLKKQILSYKGWTDACLKEMREYHTREKQNMMHRMKALSQTLPEKVRGYMDNVDPFSIFYAIFNESADKGQIQTGWLPSQQLDEMIKLQANIYRKINQIQQVVEPFEETPAPPSRIPVERPIGVTLNKGWDARFATQINSAESIKKRSERLQNKVYTQDALDLAETLVSIETGQFTSTSANPQFNIPDVSVLGIKIKDLILQAVFRPVTALNYSEKLPVGDCNICNDEKELVAGCPNSPLHRTCLECWEGMQRNDIEECPNCRTPGYKMLEQTSLFARFLPTFYTREVYNCVSGKLASLYNDPMASIRNMRDWLTRSPYGKLLISASITVLYAVLLSHAKAICDREQHDRIHNLCEALGISHWAPTKADKMYGLIGWNNWNMHLCATLGSQRSNCLPPTTLEVDPQLGTSLTGYYQLPNNMGIPQILPIPGDWDSMFEHRQHNSIAQMDADDPIGNFMARPEVAPDTMNIIDQIRETAERRRLENLPDDDLASVNEEPIEEEVDDMQDDVEEVREPIAPFQDQINEEVQQVPTVISDRSPLVLREIAPVAPIPIGLGECPHVHLWDCCVDPTQTCKITYEWDFGSERFGWYSDELMLNFPDAPCQYPECPLLQGGRRQYILHRWALAREHTVRAAMANWRPGADWPLPEEFRTDIAVQLNTRVQDHIQQQIRTFADPIRPHWTEFVSDVWNQMWKALKLAMAMITAISTVIKTIQFAKWIGSNMFGKEAQIIGSGSINTTKLPRTPRLPRNATPGRVVAHINESQVTSALNNVQRNTFFLQCEYMDGTSQKRVNMRGLGLFGRIGIIPAHYGKYLINAQKRLESKEISNLKILLYPFQNKEVVLPINVTPSVLAFTDSEHCYFKTPPQFPLFKDLTHLIPTALEHNNVGSEYWHIEPSATTSTVLQVDGSITGFMDTLTINGTSHFDAYKIFDVYATSYGRKGACGSVYMNSTTKPIFALHVAGNDSPFNTSGYGIPLIKEDIDAMKEGKSVLSYFLPVCADANISLPGAILPITTIEPKQKPKIPEKTKIIKSLVSDLFEYPPITAPAILSSRDPRWLFDKSPLYWGCLKHTMPPLPFNKRILVSTFEELKTKLIPKLKPLRSVEKLSYVDAIRGIQNVEYFDSLDMSTSVGWPWNIGQRKRKDDWIKFDRDDKGFMQNVEIDQKLLDTMNMKDSLRERGIKPFTVFLDWLKDERRKASKLAKPDGTRIFSLSPVDFTIQLRQSTLDFSAAFMSQFLNINSIVGITCDGPAWSRLANTLLQFSPHIITFDYSDFGPRLPADVGYYAFELMIDWYKEYSAYADYFAQRLSVIREEIFSAYHLMNDFIYQTVCGAPSGTATTVIQNTLVNILMLRYIWRYIILTQGIDPSYLDKFDEYVSMFLYGDDGIMSVKDEVLAWFNLVSIMHAFNDHDIIITDAEKLTSRKRGEPIPNLEKIPLSQKLESSTVLKRGFLKHPFRKNHWLAPLDEASITDAVRWVWTSPDLKEATVINCEQSILLAFGHGPKYFNKWKTVVNEKLKKVNLSPVHKVWSDLDINFFGDPELQGSYIPTTWDRGTFGLMVNEQKAVKPEKKLENTDFQSSRQNGHDGLKANVVRVRDRDLITFDNVGGGILPSALNFELEFSSSLMDTSMLNTGGNATDSEPFWNGTRNTMILRNQ